MPLPWLLQWAGVLSRVALEQERILNPVLDRVRTADHHQLRSLTGLIRNLSRNARNKDEMCEYDSHGEIQQRTPQQGMPESQEEVSSGHNKYLNCFIPAEAPDGTPCPWCPASLTSFILDWQQRR